MKCWKIFFLCW